jgi:hypothetical protein
VFLVPKVSAFYIITAEAQGSPNNCLMTFMILKLSIVIDAMRTYMLLLLLPCGRGRGFRGIIPILLFWGDNFLRLTGLNARDAPC